MAYYLPSEYIHAFNVMYATKIPAMEGYFLITPRMLTSAQRALIIEGFEFWGVTSIASSTTMLVRVDDRGAWLYFADDASGGVGMSYMPLINPLYAHLKRLAPIIANAGGPRRSARLAAKHN